VKQNEPKYETEVIVKPFTDKAQLLMIYGISIIEFYIYL